MSSYCFWAYNKTHLEYIERYVETGLSERNNHTSSTLVKKIPQFVKSAKNIKDPLKLINAMKERQPAVNTSNK